MFHRIIQFSVENKLLIFAGVLAMILLGVFSARQIPLDAVPDITSNQVQIVSVSPTLAPQEVEQLITYPLEFSMTNIPDVEEVRSISRYGLSVITIVFDDKVDIMTARQYVQEQLNVARDEIPAGLTETELMPITTGLGEIYQYVLTVDPAHAHMYDATELRTIQDWIVKRQLNGTPGIIEVSSFGGYLKQYEVAIDPSLLRAYDLTMQDVIAALERNNRNSGGSYIEEGPYSFYIRTEGRAESMEEIAAIVVRNYEGTPVRIGDISTVRIGSAKRFGAMTMDGKGEVVGGITLMLKGANSSEALKNVKERIEEVRASLPEGVDIYPYLDRSRLIGKTIHTVRNNLLEGGAIVILILLLLVGNIRAGLIVASIIPLSMLFAFIMMRIFGISANLMSLGAIDFGIVVDGAVIIVESLLHTLGVAYVGRKLTQSEMDNVVIKSTVEIYRSAAFGVLIILIVFVPILALEGIEGKTFRPMAQTVGFAILGSLILSMTYVPVASSLFLKKSIKKTRNFSDRLIGAIKSVYRPALGTALRYPLATIGTGAILLAISVMIFSRLGAEFVPTLEEGDLAMQQTIKPGSALEESIRTSTRAEKILLDNFPEVTHVVSKIGTAEVPTDPMAIEDADIMIILKDKEEWVSASTREALIAKMKAALQPITWAEYEFTQPIQLRFNELMTGAKSDIAVKIFGEDVHILKEKADRAAEIISVIPGAADIRVDQTEGLQQINIEYNRLKLAQYGVNVDEVNQIIRAAYAGEVTGVIFEQERKFDLVVRLQPEYRSEFGVDNLFVTTYSGDQVPVSELVTVEEVEGPSLIRREQARRFINIGVNVRNRDVASLVADIESALAAELDLPPGYTIQYGGQFENLRQARARLLVAVPVALLLIVFLLYLAFNSVRDALIIFIAVPLSAIGGILSLYLRGMPFSISSGIGFIALFGVSVLNGIVLLSAIKNLDMRDYEKFEDLITSACLTRLRPVLMTALVAAFGFLPMALSTSNGAEVQRPLATVVIGGLISSTILTLFILPAIYRLVNRQKFTRTKIAAYLLLLGLGIPGIADAQVIDTYDELYEYAMGNNPSIANYELEIAKTELDLKTVGQWDPLRIDYQGGNINFVGYDNFFTVTQDFSHLFNKRARRDVTESEIQLQRTRQEAFFDGFSYQLKTLYYDRLYWNAKLRLWREIEQTYAGLQPKLELQYQEGEIDGIELSLMQTELLQIRQNAAFFEQKLSETEQEIRAVAFLPDTVALSDNEIALIEIDSQQINANLKRYLEIFNANQQYILRQAELEKKLAGQPNLELGYFHQSTLSEWGFQGWQAGVGIPIDRRTANARVKQLKLQEDILGNSKEAFQKRYESRIKTLSDQIRISLAALGTYDRDFFDNQQQLKDMLDLQYAEGSIDFLRYQQIRTRYLNAEDRYLELIKAYNDSVLSLMHYIPK